DRRADIFAFGAILYEMLTAKRAFQKPTSAETMTAILNEDPPDISQIGPSIPAALERTVHRCLEKNPEQRFQSASDLAFALEALSDSTVIRRNARRTIAPARAKLPASLLVIVAVVVTILVVSWITYRSPNTSSVAPAAEWVQLTNFVDSATSPA